MCVIIIGAGPAGCEAAYRLAQAGETVELIEKESETGGNLNNWYQLFPDRKQARDLNQSLRQNIQHPDIHLHLGNYPVKISRTENNKFTLELNDGALLKGDALLVTSGFRLFNARRKEEYGYGIYENVITSVELENFFINHHIATSTGQIPKRIGLIHCVGSRDEKICNYHCSKLCCVTAVKQAIELREMLPETEILCFYMDMRMFGPGYEELYREAQEKYFRRQYAARFDARPRHSSQWLYPGRRPPHGNQPNQPARHFYCRMQLLSHEPDRHTHRCTFCSDHYRRISEK